MERVGKTCVDMLLECFTYFELFDECSSAVFVTWPAGGVQNRTRFIAVEAVGEGVKNCSGDASQMQGCNLDECPSDCQYEAGSCDRLPAPNEFAHVCITGEGNQRQKLNFWKQKPRQCLMWALWLQRIVGYIVLFLSDLHGRKTLWRMQLLMNNSC